MSFIGSMTPTGPIALIVLRRGVRRQNLSALSVASGAALAEAGYALLAYLGISFALSRYPLQTFVLRIIAGTILIVFAMICIFGSHYLQPKAANREYPGASFLLGLSIAGLNPTLFVTWTGAVAAVRGLGLISDIHAAPVFAIGVVVGPVLWFWILLKVLGRHVESFRPETLVTIEKFLPIALLVLAGIIMAQAFIPLMGR